MHTCTHAPRSHLLAFCSNLLLIRSEIAGAAVSSFALFLCSGKSFFFPPLFGNVHWVAHLPSVDAVLMEA